MFSTIQNYYEHLVYERMIEVLGRPQNEADKEYFDDVGCIALNHLPPRYVRHSVDIAFHLTDKEWDDLKRQVAEAISQAIEFTKRRHSERPPSGEYGR